MQERKIYRQTTDTLLMVRPACFGYNEETAASNAFQKQDGSMSPSEIRGRALAEFDAFVARLRSEGIHVEVVDDVDIPAKPDAVFPNNWVSFHQDGAIVTYPMYAGLRRLERREDVLTGFIEKFSFSRRLHFENYEENGQFLEGTGSMIFDRSNRLAYACISPRTDAALFEEFCRQLGFQPVAFTAVDGHGQEIYHTNVLMALGETFVVICLDTVRNEQERRRLLELFAQTKKEVVDITLEQMMAFAGNMLQVRNEAGQTYLVMSEQAFRSLRQEQIEKLEQHTQLLYSSLYTIETFGGGSARCMMAEVFYP